MSKNRGEYIPPAPRWTPFEEVMPPRSVQSVEKLGRTYQNSRYLVIYREYPKAASVVCYACEAPRDSPETCKFCGGTERIPMPALRHLSVRRLDNRPVRHWRDLQRIKNEFLGEDAYAWEAFPPESELVDSSNQYHLLSMQGIRLPSPYRKRLVVYCPETLEGQEPFEEGLPEGTVTETILNEAKTRTFLEHVARGGSAHAQLYLADGFQHDEAMREDEDGA